MLAKHFACPDILKSDSSAASRDCSHAHHARNYKIDIAIGPLAAHHVLVALTPCPFALRRNFTKAETVQPPEQFDLLQT
jgi:hypothetical protein